MAVKGVFASDQNIIGTRRGDFASALLQTMPTGTAALLALTAGMESSGAGDTVVTWFEENHLSGRINVTNNASTGTSFIVDDASFTTVGTMYLIEASGEYVFIEAVSGLTLTVDRGFAGTSIVSIDGSSTVVPIQRIGTGFEEGSAKPTAVANLGFPRFNYMQIFRNAWNVTKTTRHVEFHTGDVVAKNKRDAAMFHSEDIERSLWFGKKVIGVQNSQPFRMMDGVDAQIVTNIETQGSNLTRLELNAFIQVIFERNIKGKPNERIAFCGNSVVNTINELALLTSTMNIIPGITEFGMKVTKWLTPFGDISLMTHPLFNESPNWTKDLYVLHPGAIKTRYLRRTDEDDDAETAGTDADFGVFTTEMCITYRAELTAGKFTGIDTAA